MNSVNNDFYYLSIHSTSLPSTGSGWSGFVEHSRRTDWRSAFKCCLSLFFLHRIYTILYLATGITMSAMESPPQSLIEFFSEKKEENKNYNFIPDDVKKLMAIGAPQLINKPWHYVEHKIPGGALAACFAADNVLLSADRYAINWFDCQKGAIEKSVIYESDGSIVDVCFDKKGQHMAVVRNKRSYIIDLSSLDQPVINIECALSNYYVVDTVCSNHDDSKLAIALRSCIYFYDMKTGKQKEKVIGYGHIGSLRRICFSPVESICAVLNDEYEVIIGNDITEGWRMEKRCVVPQQESVESLCFNHDGTQLAVVSPKNVSIFNADTGQLLWSLLFKEFMSSVCFDGVGKRVAVGSECWVDSKYVNITRIIAQYDNYTLDQLMLRKIMHLWLQLKKPKSNICSVEKMFKNIACLLRLDRKELDTVWSSFPEFMQAAIAETMLTKIAYYKHKSVGVEKHKERCKKKVKKVTEAVKKALK